MSFYSGGLSGQMEHELWVRDSTPLWPWPSPCLWFLLLSREHMASEGLQEHGWKSAGMWQGSGVWGQETICHAIYMWALVHCAASSRAGPPQQGDRTYP